MHSVPPAPVFPYCVSLPAFARLRLSAYCARRCSIAAFLMFF
jgi:hypothetical protein